MSIWRERLDRWLGPLAQRVPVHPNVITILALVLNLAGAAALALAARDRRLFLVTVILVSTGGLLDALDGIVARLQDRATRFGDFLDHLCDRISDLSLFAAWIVGVGVRLSIGIPALLLIMLNGYIGTQLEATFAKRSYDTIGRGEFVLGLVAFPIIAFTAAPSPYYLPIVDGMTALAGLAALAGFIQRLREAVRLRHQP